MCLSLLAVLPLRESDFFLLFFGGNPHFFQGLKDGKEIMVRRMTGNNFVNAVFEYILGFLVVLIDNKQALTECKAFLNARSSSTISV